VRVHVWVRSSVRVCVSVREGAGTAYLCFCVRACAPALASRYVTQLCAGPKRQTNDPRTDT